MIKENAYMVHWRRFRKLVFAKEQPLIDLCQQVVDEHFDNTGSNANNPRYQIVKRYTKAVALYEFTSLSLKEIGAIVGLDYSVVIYGRRKLRKTYLNHSIYGPMIQACFTVIEQQIDTPMLTREKKPYVYELA